MFKSILNKLKQWTSFPSVRQPPQAIASTEAKRMVNINIAMALALYAVFGDIVVSIVAIGLFAFSIFVQKNTDAKKFINKRYVLLLISLACLALFLIRFHGSTGGRSWMGLLALLTSIKLLETNNLRDYFVAVILLYFFTAIIFAYHNSAIAPLFLALFSISTAATLMLLSSSNQLDENLNKKHKSKAIKTKTVIKQASFLFAQALPITIILFFLFPRIQGTFGFLPDEDSNLNPSFGDSMKAGDFQQRSTNYGIAFRAEFEQSQNITPEVLYWRVKTISKQQGLKWNQNDKVDKLPKNSFKTADILPTNEKQTVTYTLTHQATSDTQLPSLEKVVSTTNGKILLNDSIQTTQDFSTTFQYKLTSTLPEKSLSAPSISTASYSLDNEILSSYLRTAYAPRKQTRQLLDSWLSQHNLPSIEPGNQFSLESLNSERAKRLAQTALDHFKNQPFKYHLLPPELDQSAPIEDFLFRTQSGYCEHYASTFSTLMRWLGVPSRVVVGYQGGEYNSQGNFYEVRYSNGHAWSEIWTQSDGWIRVDPTFAVAPERIEFGMDALLSLLGDDDVFESGQYNRQKLADVLNPSGSKRFFKSTSQWLSSANHSWDKWVVNYGFEQQRELLKRLGLNTKNQHITLLGILGTALALIFAVILFFIWPRKTKLPPVDAGFQLFKNKLLKQGFHIPLHEGPQDLEGRLSARYTEKQADIHQICQYYIQYKYQNKQIDVAKFMQMVKQFRLNS